MHLSLRRVSITKAVPLAISRGITATAEHIVVTLEHEGITGVGETGGFDTGHRHYDTQSIATELRTLAPILATLSPQPLQALDPLLAQLSSPARCGLDLALHDWWGKRLQLPVHRLWGLDPSVCAPTSVTLGLGTPEAVLARLERWWQQLPASRIKLKLGSPDGLDHDRVLLAVIAEALERRRQVTGRACDLHVDANGGWSIAGTRAMLPALEEASVVLLEQPLPPLSDPHADTAAFAALAGLAALPLVADESCWTVADLVRLAPHVQGVNIKLLKSGGLAEALLMARLARRLGLAVMVGCYSDSALLNGAAAQLLPLVDWPDLDSHLNLVDDPFVGPTLDGDRLRPGQGPGLGVRACDPRGAPC